MQNLFKLLFLLVPAVAIILYIHMSDRTQMDMEIKVEEAKFDREWASMRSSTALDPETKADQKERAAEAEKKLKEMDEELARAEARQKKLIKDFEDAIQEKNKELEKGRADKKTSGQ